MAEDALRSDISCALAVGIAQVLLQALVVVGTEGPDVGLEHGDAGDGGVTDGVLAAHRPGGQGSVRERGLQSVQQVHDDVDELEKEIEIEESKFVMKKLH